MTENPIQCVKLKCGQRMNLTLSGSWVTSCKMFLKQPYLLANVTYGLTSARDRDQLRYVLRCYLALDCAFITVYRNDEIIGFWAISADSELGAFLGFSTAQRSRSNPFPCCQTMERPWRSSPAIPGLDWWLWRMTEGVVYKPGLQLMTDVW